LGPLRRRRREHRAFGASAPGETVLHELGINPENVVEHALALLAAQP